MWYEKKFEEKMRLYINNIYYKLFPCLDSVNANK